MYHGLDVIYDERSGLDETQLSDAMNELSGHISGASSLDATSIDTARDIIVLHAPLLPTNLNLMSQAFDLIDAFEASTFGPLFLNTGSITRDPSTSDGQEIERAALQIQQAILDKVYDGTLQEFQSFDRIYDSMCRFSPGSQVVDGNLLPRQCRSRDYGSDCRSHSRH